MQALCFELHIDPNHYTPQSLQVLQDWCYQHISRDRVYAEVKATAYSQYLDLAKDFIDVFKPNCSAALDQPIQAFSNQNAIQYAARHGYDRFISAQQGLAKAIWDKADSRSLTPLHLAAIDGYFYTTQALLSQGANPMIENQMQQLACFTALWLPITHDPEWLIRKERVFNLLIDHTPAALLHRDDSGDTVYHWMAAANWFELFVQSLASHPEMVHCLNNHRQYLIHTAILNGSVEIVARLLQEKEVASQLDARKRTPLHYAATVGSEKILNLCMAAAPTLDPRDSDEKTPLMLAVEANDLNVVRLLLNAGALATPTDSSGKTILDYAKNLHTTQMMNWIIDNTVLR